VVPVLCADQPGVLVGSGIVTRFGLGGQDISGGWRRRIPGSDVRRVCRRRRRSPATMLADDAATVRPGLVTVSCRRGFDSLSSKGLLQRFGFIARLLGLICRLRVSQCRPCLRHECRDGLDIGSRTVPTPCADRQMIGLTYLRVLASRERP
jgi:hypothetical protein